MVVVRGRPPLWEEIDKKFGVLGKPVIFSWGEKVFNPEGIYIPAWLEAHEIFHGSRQKDPESWWRRYLTDDRFRLQEELPAHRVEFQAFCRSTLDRNLRAKFLQDVSIRLSSELYGNLISPTQALRALR